MQHDLNKALFTGRIEAPPILERLDSGSGVCTRFLLVSQRAGQGGQDVTERIPCVAEARLAELLARQATAGTRVLVEGRIQTRRGAGTNASTAEIALIDVTFLGGDRSRRGTRPSDEDDDVPFGYYRDDES